MKPDLTTERLLQKIKDLENEVDKLIKNRDYDMERLYDWLMDENRRQANTFFTSGALRNVAAQIEFVLWQHKRENEKDKL